MTSLVGGKTEMGQSLCFCIDIKVKTKAVRFFFCFVLILGKTKKKVNFLFRGGPQTEERGRKGGREGGSGGEGGAHSRIGCAASSKGALRDSTAKHGVQLCHRVRNFGEGEYGRASVKEDNAPLKNPEISIRARLLRRKRRRRLTERDGRLYWKLSVLGLCVSFSKDSSSFMLNIPSPT